MRCMVKLAEPDVLRDNGAQWLQDFLLDTKNKTNKYRYRHSDIKTALTNETHDKCIYCESKIGHNTPSDIEHKVPSSKDRSKHFMWANLTIACTECNRRKNDFYLQQDGFLDPYTDPVDDYLHHLGPIVTWKPGKERGELFVTTLELCSPERMRLVAQKIEKFAQLQHVLERYVSAPAGPLREMLKRQLGEMAGPKAEYSAMVRDALRQKGHDEVLA